MTLPAEITIEVTADDIGRGVPVDPCQCPIALAAKRLGLDVVGVDEDGIYVDQFDAAYLIPEEAATFIDLFDSGETVAPFVFTARMSEGYSEFLAEFPPEADD